MVNMTVLSESELILYEPFSVSCKHSINTTIKSVLEIILLTQSRHKYCRLAVNEID